MYNKKHNVNNPYFADREDLFCPFCGKQCKNLNSFTQHTIRCKLNPERIYIPPVNPNNLKNRGWSKGLTTLTDARVKNSRDAVCEYYKTHHGYWLGKHFSEETKKKLHQLAIDNHYEERFHSRKVYIYNEMKFASSYEVTVAKSLDLNGVRWLKPKRLSYVDLNGKDHHYTADFYLPDYDVYLDPKNDYLINNINKNFGYCDVDKIKWVSEQNHVRILILNKDQLCWEEILKLIVDID